MRALAFGFPVCSRVRYAGSIGWPVVRLPGILKYFKVYSCVVVSAEGWPSGQRQQTVNLPTYVYVGSNPTPSTTLFRVE